MVSWDTSTANASAASSITVKQQPSTAMLSPTRTSDRSSPPAAIVTLAPLSVATAARTEPFAATMPVNICVKAPGCARRAITRRSGPMRLTSQTRSSTR